MCHTERAVTLGSSNYRRSGHVEQIEANARFTPGAPPL
jgi:hypothetical protein